MGLDDAGRHEGGRRKVPGPLQRERGGEKEKEGERQDRDVRIPGAAGNRRAEKRDEARKKGDDRRGAPDAENPPGHEGEAGNGGEVQENRTQPQPGGLTSGKEIGRQKEVELRRARVAPAEARVRPDEMLAPAGLDRPDLQNREVVVGAAFGPRALENGNERREKRQDRQQHQEESDQ